MKHSLILVLALSLLAIGCGKKAEAPATDKAAEAAAPAGTPDETGVYLSSDATLAAEAAAPAGTPDATKMFTERCASCHGATGQGDGPAAASLEPKPRNYTDKAWQAKVTDEDIKKIISSGGLAVGKSPLMPPQSDLKDKPAELDALVKYIRAFAK